MAVRNAGRMRIQTVLLLSVLACGCGGSSDELVAVPVNSPPPVVAPLPINSANALRLTHAISELTVPSGRHSLEVAGGDLTHVEIDGVAAALVELPLAYPVLDQAPSRTFPGHGGGNAALMVRGADVTMVFRDFITEDGSRLNGTAFLTGELDDYSGNVRVRFQAFEIADPDGDYKIDGPVTLFIHRTATANGHEERIERTLGVTVTDVRHGGTVQFIDGFSESDIITENGVQTGFSDNTGKLLFANYHGFTGLAERIPVIPFGFNVVEATLVSTVTSGESLLVGDGTLRTRIVDPNVFEVAVRPAGATDFEVVGPHGIPDEDHQP